MDHICIESLKDYIRKISTASVANGLGWGHLHLILNKCQVPMFSQLVDQKTRRQKQLKDIILQLRSGIIYDQSLAASILEVIYLISCQEAATTEEDNAKQRFLLEQRIHLAKSNTYYSNGNSAQNPTSFLVNHSNLNSSDYESDLNTSTESEIS